MRTKQAYFQDILDIALSIGNSLNLSKMLDQALTTYMLRMECIGTGVYQCKKDLGYKKYTPELVRRLWSSANSEIKLPDFYDQFKFLNSVSSREMYVKLRLNALSYCYLFRLPDFGFFYLIKEEIIDEELFPFLIDLNQKLAVASIACVKSTLYSESEKRYKDLSELVPEMIYEIDLEGNIMSMNRTSELIMGYSDKDINQGLSLFDLVRKEDLILAKEKFKEVKINKNLPPRDYMAVTKNGKTIPVIVYTNHILEQDKIIGIRYILIDITERKEFEQKLKGQIEQLELALYASDSGLWDLDLITGKFQCNDRWMKIRGLKAGKDNLNLESMMEFIHPEDVNEIRMLFQEFLSNKKKFFQLEYRVKTGKDQYVWILDTGRVTEFDVRGEPVKLVGTNININAKKHRQLVLRKNLVQQELLSEVALRLNLLESFETRINFVLKKIGEHTEVSRLYIFEDSMDGLTTSNTYEWCNTGVLPQKSDLQGIPYSYIPSWKRLLIEEGRVYSQNIRELPPDIVDILEPQNIMSIVVYPLYVHGHKSTDKDGSFFGFIGFDDCNKNKRWLKSELELLRTLSGIISNAFERKIAESNLHESEEKNRAIVESIPDDLFHVNKDGLILGFKNSSKGNKLRLKSDQIINRRMNEIFPVEVAESILKAIDGCLQTGFIIMEYQIKLESEELSCEARITKLNQNEVIIVSRDISEQKEYEKRLEAERDKANEANRAKSEFLANMSHEIRTPMNAILGFSEALFHKLDNAQHKKMIQSILSSGNLLLSLLNDILDLSKIEAGKIEVSPQPTNLSVVIEEIKLLFLDKARVKGIDIVVEIDNGFPTVVMLDEIRFKQVIFNLVGNAFKFTHKGYIKISLCFNYLEEIKGNLIMKIQDTGIGVPEDQQEIIFEVFRQQSGQDNRQYGGAGLGLTISKRLIEKMNGCISLISKPGMGSVFTVEIPDIKVSQHYIPEIDERYRSLEHIKFEKASVMVVDDVSINIEIVENHLNELGLVVTSAESGYIALEILKFNKPDIILMDLRMPGMDGSEVVKKIKMDNDLKNIPVIAYTASVFGVENDKEFEMFDGRLFKPVRKIELIGVLSEFLKYEEVSFHDDGEIVEKDVSEPFIFSDVLKKEIVAVIDELENNYLVIWNEIKYSLILFKIEDFATDLKEFCARYEISSLNKYANQLTEDIENIDLEAIQKDLKKFPWYVNQIKIYQNEN